jgi:hypothetical protein
VWPSSVPLRMAAQPEDQHVTLDVATAASYKGEWEVLPRDTQSGIPTTSKTHGPTRRGALRRKWLRAQGGVLKRPGKNVPWRHENISPLNVCSEVGAR